jgi:hypothetical protein
MEGSELGLCQFVLIPRLHKLDSRQSMLDHQLTKRLADSVKSSFLVRLVKPIVGHVEAVDPEFPVCLRLRRVVDVGDNAICWELDFPSAFN